MKRGIITARLLLALQTALAAPVPLAQLLAWSRIDSDIDSAVAAYGFQPYGVDTANGEAAVRNYGDNAAPPRNISWVGAEQGQADAARLGYDVYDPAEIRALQADLAQAGFVIAEQGEVSRAHYALYRNAEGREVQINTPKRQGAAVGFVFYRQAAE